MKSLADEVQHAALAALGDAPEARLEALRPALRSLRAAYRSGEAPDFSERDTRAAYVFAYHPHHCVLAAEALAASGMTLLGIEHKDPVRVTVLGAGPAPELVALAWWLRDTGIAIEAHLVDREPGWQWARKTTVDDTIARWSSASISVTHHVADLQATDGLEAIADLVDGADLVITQALLTELDSPTRPGHLLDHLIGWFGADTRLLVTDFDCLRNTRESTQALDEASNAALLTSASFELPAARPLPQPDRHLFASEDGLRPRKRLRCSLRLLARPGTPPPTSRRPARLSATQGAALAGFRDFLRGDQRIFVLRGAAGTGKTTLVPTIVDEAASQGLPVVLLAPTGQAARRLEHVAGRAGSTLHSHLYRFSRTSGRDQDAPVSEFVRRDPPAAPAIYIVDEASLIGDTPADRDEFEAAEVRFGEGRLLSDLLSTCLHADRSRVVLLGDPQQLPPIGEDASPALDSNRLRELAGSDPVLADLKEVLRQDETSGILDLANAWLREGSTPSTCRHDPDAGVVLRPTSQLDPWLTRELTDLQAVIVAARNADVRAWNERVRRANGRGGEPPSAGERLLVVRTDFHAGVVNGDELKIITVDPDTELIRLRGDEVVLRRAHLMMKKASGPLVFSALLVDNLLPGASTADQRLVTRVLHADFVRRTGLRPGHVEFLDSYMADECVHAVRASYAYARTCHRAQGGEWQNVMIDFAGVQAFGPHEGRWAYTALTRARRAVHLVRARESAFDKARLVNDATGCLQAVDLRVVDHQTIQDGVQITVARGEATVAVNLYLRRGRPSKAVPSGPDAEGLHGIASAALNGWATETRVRDLPPLPTALEALIGRLTGVLAELGYDLTAEQSAQYQLSLKASAPGQEAVIIHNYNAGGVLGSEREASASASGPEVEVTGGPWVR